MRLNPIASVKKWLSNPLIHRLRDFTEPEDLQQHNDADAVGHLTPIIIPEDHVEQHATASHAVQRNSTTVRPSSPLLSSIGVQFGPHPEWTPGSQGWWQNIAAPTEQPNYAPPNHQYYPPPLVWNNIRELPEETRLFPDQFVSVSSGMQTIVSAGIDEYLVSVIKEVEVTATGGAPGQIRIIAPDAFFLLESMRHITVLFGTRAFLVKVVERLPSSDSATPLVHIPLPENLTGRSQSSDYYGPLLQDPRTRTQVDNPYVDNVGIVSMEEETRGISRDPLQSAIQDQTRFRPFDGSPLSQTHHRPTSLPIQRPRNDELHFNQLSPLQASPKQHSMPPELLTDRDPEQSTGNHPVRSQSESFRIMSAPPSPAYTVTIHSE